MLGAFSLKGLGFTSERHTGTVAAIQFSTDTTIADAVGRWRGAHKAVPHSLTVAGA